MKPFLFLALVLTVVAIAGDTSNPNPSVRQVARYRLFRAPVTMATDRVGMEVNCVFRIDSQTGDTCIYRCFVSTNSSMIGWDRIPDLPAVAKPRKAVDLGSQSVETLSAFLRWADENKDGTTEYTAEQIARRRAEVEDYVRTAIGGTKPPH